VNNTADACSLSCGVCVGRPYLRDSTSSIRDRRDCTWRAGVVTHTRLDNQGSHVVSTQGRPQGECDAGLEGPVDGRGVAKIACPASVTQWR